MVGTLQSIDFEHVRRIVPLVAILSRYGITEQLKKSGAQLKGACPIHNGRNKQQFVVNPSTNVWTCFGDCGRGGGTLEFVAAMEGVDVHRAAHLIAEWFALTPTEALKKRRSTMSDKQGRPSHKVFVVEDRGEGNDSDAFWTRIGSAWPHKDGKGINVVLAALPINGRLVLREFTDDDVKEEETKKPVAKSRK